MSLLHTDLFCMLQHLEAVFEVVLYFQNVLTILNSKILQYFLVIDAAKSIQLISVEVEPVFLQHTAVCP